MPPGSLSNIFEKRCWSRANYTIHHIY